MDDADEIDDDEGVEVAEQVQVAVDDDGGDVDGQIEAAEVGVNIAEEEEEFGNMMEEDGQTNAAGDGRGGGGAVDQRQGEVEVEGGDGGDAVGDEGAEQQADPPGPPLPTLEELHNTAIPTHKWPPKQCRADFTREAGALWDKVASNPGDVYQWVRLLMFARAILPATSPRSSALSLADQVKDRLRRWRAGESAQLWREAVQHLEQPRRGRKRRQEEEETEEQKTRKRNARRAFTIATEGQFTKSLQALTSAGMADHTAATERQMRSKHPLPQRPVGPLPTTEHSPITFISSNVLKLALNFRKGSAPGPSGLRPEHLRVVLQCTSARRDSALVSLTKLLNKMMAGSVPQEVAPYLCGARLHAARKKDGGIRPVAVGNLLRRLACKCAASAVADKAATLLAPHQLGVGIPGGAEVIIHATRQAVDAAEDKYVLQADLVNAFNCADRACALEEVKTHFPELLAWVSTAYGTSSNLIFGKALILSMVGFHQGDPLASLLFSLVLHPIILQIEAEVPTLDLNAWFLDDGTLVGTEQELCKVVDILQAEGPSRGLILSTAVTTPDKPKTTIWSKSNLSDNPDLHNRGIARVREPGIILLGAPLGQDDFTARVLQEKVDKVAAITSLLPDIKDPHVEFCLLRSCLALPKLMFLLRTVDTTKHQPILMEFDRLVREALIRILGCPLGDKSWDQAKLPVSMAGLGLRSAIDHSSAAFATSYLSSQQLARQLLHVPDDQESPDLSPTVVASLSAKMGDEEEVSQDTLKGQKQKMVSAKIDLLNKRIFLERIADSGDERDIARLSSLCLPQAGAWLNCTPLPALGLHLRGPEFVVAAKIRLGLPVYDQPGPCPNCGRASDVLGDHSLVCGTGGERIVRHNAVRDAIFDTAAAAGLAPLKEGRALLPGNNRRPADVFLPHWAGGLDAALDVTITHPLQAATRAGAAATPGHAMTVAFENKCRDTEELCREQGIKFIPIVAESLGGWHKVALEQFRKLGSALARHTGQGEDEKVGHLVKRVAILLQRGLSSMLLNRIPGHPPAEIDGQE